MRTIANTRIPLRTGSEVRAQFESRGLSIAAWARCHGFSAPLVYQVLAGHKRCLRGQSHQIAVLLGLKYGELGSIDDIWAGPADAALVSADRVCEAGTPSELQAE